MRRQAERYGARVEDGMVTALAGQAGNFLAQIGEQSLRAQSVLLATGVVNRRPTIIDDACHNRALAAGQLRYCPICDAYEVTDKSIAVLGTGERAFNEAIFLRSYSAEVTLIAPEGGHDLTSDQRTALAESGIVVAGQGASIYVDGDQIQLDIDGETRRFDTLYPSLGSDIRSELAIGVRARRTAEGCLIVDAHQRTNVPGLYAAGDVVLGLDQISHAMGEGGVAATTIRNDLAKTRPLRR